jgi:MORN repeat
LRTTTTTILESFDAIFTVAVSVSDARWVNCAVKGGDESLLIALISRSAVQTGAVKTGGFRYEDGTRYIGDWNQKGQKHGMGHLLLPDGTRYGMESRSVKNALMEKYLS